MALTAQLGVHATGPVGPVALSVHTTNLANQRRVRDRPLRRRPRRPCVVARPRDLKHPAHRRDGVVRLLRLDEPKHRYRVSFSLTKKAAAFFSISRSSRRTRFSRRSRLSSSRSSLLTPSARPASTSSRLSHVRSVCCGDPQAPRRLGQRPLTGADQRDGFTTELLGVRRARLGHGHHILPAGPDRPKRSSVHGPGGIPSWLGSCAARRRASSPGCRAPRLSRPRGSRRRAPPGCRRRRS